MNKEILGFKAPEKECTDQKCPFHGQLKAKKELFKGKVIKKDVYHTATIEMFRSVYIKKYERYETKRSRMRVHNPGCINAEVGQEVVVARTRPLSKTKNSVILGIEVKSKGAEAKNKENKSESKIKDK